MKQIFCQTEENFANSWKELKKLGYKHPNGGELTDALCFYQYSLGTKYINIYPNTKTVKFALKAIK